MQIYWPFFFIVNGFLKTYICLIFDRFHVLKEFCHTIAKIVSSSSNIERKSSTFIKINRNWWPVLTNLLDLLFQLVQRINVLYSRTQIVTSIFYWSCTQQDLRYNYAIRTKCFFFLFSKNWRWKREWTINWYLHKKWIKIPFCCW